TPRERVCRLDCSVQFPTLESPAVYVSRLRLLVICCVLPAAFAFAASSASATAAKPRPRQPGLINCAHKVSARPRLYTLACGDGTAGLSHLSWTSFGGATARATGIFGVNLCDPNCAAGKIERRRAKVVATRPGTFHGKRTYTRLTVTATKTGRSLGHFR